MTPTLTGTPTLETDRLILRAPRPSDAEAYIAFYGSDRAQFVGGPKDRRAAWDFFGTVMAHWLMRGFGMFAVTRKGEDTPLGIIGHWYPETWPEREVGWVLFDQQTEGTGIAQEAATAVLDHAWNVLKWDTIVSYIAHGNARSVVLAERLGATLDPNARTPKPDVPCYVYRHPRPAS